MQVIRPVSRRHAGSPALVLAPVKLFDAGRCARLKSPVRLVLYRRSFSTILRKKPVISALV